MSASVAKRLGKLKSTFAPMLWRRGGMNSALRRPQRARQTRQSARGLQSALAQGRNEFRAPIAPLIRQISWERACNLGDPGIESRPTA